MKNVNLKVEKGEFVAIIGPSGSGKSSLLLSLNGLIPNFVLNTRVEGEINCMGINVLETDPSTCIRYIGLTLEDPAKQITSLTVEDDLAFGPSNLGYTPTRIRELLKYALKVSRLKGFEKRNPHTLSGGEQQSLVIGGVLAITPKILALDEPISMLDPIGKNRILSILRDLKKEGVTIILTDSGMNIEYITEYADRLIFMKEGEILAEGTPREVFTKSEIIEKFGREIPQVTELVLKLGEENPNLIPVTLEEAHKYLSEKLAGRKMQLPTRVEAVERKKPVIKVKNLYHTYPGSNGGVEALHGVSLTIYEGEIVGLIGQNGSGKTTLAKHLVGLLKPTNDDAEIVVDGVDVTRTSSKELLKHINYVFQNPESQLFCEKIGEEVAYGLRKMGLPEDKIKRRITKALEMFDIRKYENDYILGLKWGLKTFLALASVIAMNPKILIVDEPTTGLDKHESLMVMEQLKRLRDEGHTIIIITHHMDLLARYADHVVVMHEGKILIDGSTREVFSKPEILKKSYIFPPQITQLSQRLSNFGLPADILTVDEMYDVLSKNLV